MGKEKHKRVLVADSISVAGVKKLRQVAMVDIRTDIETGDLRRVIGDYDGLVVRGRTKVTADIIAEAGDLLVIGRAGVGVDNIDLDACEQSGIIVVNSPMAASVAVAELTIGMMLSLARRIPFADAAMKKGQWPKKELTGLELDGKTLGLVGVGRIGNEVALRAIAFGMHVIGHDPYVSPDEMRSRNIRPDVLEKVFSVANYISVHTPLTNETHHMIGTDAIGSMRNGVHILCNARGGVIDEGALLTGLRSGKVAGAALDVFEEEPPQVSLLLEHPNVIVTPHIGAQTHEAQSRAGIDVAEEVGAALAGRECRWRVV